MVRNLSKYFSLKRTGSFRQPAPQRTAQRVPEAERSDDQQFGIADSQEDFGGGSVGMPTRYNMETREDSRDDYEEYNPRKMRKIEGEAPLVEVKPNLIHDGTESPMKVLIDDEKRHTVSEKMPSSEIDPIEWGRNNLFDCDRGVPLSKELREENIQKLMRNPRKWDPQPLLRLATSFYRTDKKTLGDLAIALASTTCAINGLIEQVEEVSSVSRNADYDASSIIPKRGFNLDLAKEKERKIVLPSGATFLPSNTLIPKEVCNFTSSEFFENSKLMLRLIFAKLAYKDPYFVAYSPTASARTYISLDDQLFAVLVDFFIYGFEQRSTAALKTSIHRLILKCFNNFSDRQRKRHNMKYKDSCETVAAKLKSRIERGGVKEFPLTFDDIDAKTLKQFLNA